MTTSYQGKYPDDYPENCPPQGSVPGELFRIVSNSRNLQDADFERYLYSKGVNAEGMRGTCKAHGLSLWKSIERAKGLISRQSPRIRQARGWQEIVVGVLPKEAGPCDDRRSGGKGRSDHVTWYPFDTIDRKSYFRGLGSELE